MQKMKPYNCTLDKKLKNKPLKFHCKKYNKINNSSVQFHFLYLEKNISVLYPSVLCLFIFSVRKITEPLNLLCNRYA